MRGIDGDLLVDEDCEEEEEEEEVAMIKIFRNIHKNMLKEGLPAGQAGKTANYVKYAIGEIVLVVIGILIALQINNWNENRKQQIQQTLLLQQVLSDTKADSAFFSSRLVALDKLGSTFQSIKEFGENPSFDISKINTNGIGAVFPATRLMYSSNLLDNDIDIYKELTDFEIKTKLRMYRSKYEYVESAFINFNNRINDNWNHISTLYYKELRQNKLDKSVEALTVIYQDKELQSDVDNLIIYKDISQNRVLELLNINSELIKALTIKLNSEND